jgi:hypothetical protein
VFVDEALDAGAGVPATSGNSLTLNGSFALAGNGASEDFGGTFTQPQDDATRLLAAFKRSTSGEHGHVHSITMAEAKAMFHVK